MKDYIFGVAIAIDQLINTLIGGYPDEMLSSRAYRMRINGSKVWGRVEAVIDFIFFWQESHCLEAYLFEKSRLNFPVELR